MTKNDVLNIKVGDTLTWKKNVVRVGKVDEIYGNGAFIVVFQSGGTGTFNPEYDMKDLMDNWKLSK